MAERWDAIVIGGGAAGLACAARVGRGCLVLERNPQPGRKVLVSGGGRCNFTNLHSGPGNFLSANPDFCRSALAGWTPRDTLAWVEAAGIRWHQKHRGQLFCDRSSREILNLLLSDCREAGAALRAGVAVASVDHADGLFRVRTEDGILAARALVVASGGISWPQIGVSDLGYRLARQWGHDVVPPTPALVPLLWRAEEKARWAGLAGISLPVRVLCGRRRFEEDLLFTHEGLSGPAILQISSYWEKGMSLSIDLLPRRDPEAAWRDPDVYEKKVATLLGRWLPQRLASTILEPLGLVERRVKQMQGPDRRRLRAALKDWTVAPSDSAGFRKAEVTRGGVDTRQVLSKTFESRLRPGLHFVGEVLDVTGHLGGHNFQWAFASGRACGEALAASLASPAPDPAP